MTAKKSTAKKLQTAPETPVSDETPDEGTDTAPEPPAAAETITDPLVLAVSLEQFSIADLANRTGVPAREIRNALKPVIDDGTLQRRGDLWAWT